MNALIKNRKGLLCFAISCFSCNIQADWSANIAWVNDYLFNGVSQTQKSGALQLGLDWFNDSGAYVGVWGSNVDFGDDTNLEVDFYGGYAFSLTQDVDMDIGIAYYSYHGAGYSDEGNYPEVYVKTSYQNWQFNVWYTNDYFGTGAGHFITMVNYSMPITESVSVTFGIDRSESLDDDLYQWGDDDDDYVHWQVVFDWQMEDYNFSLGLHDTDIEEDNGSMLVAGISAAF